MVLEILFDGKERRLGVQGIENSLDQKDVDATLDETGGGRSVGLDQFVKGDIPESGILHVGRQRGGPVGGAQGPGKPILGRIISPPRRDILTGGFAN